MFYLSNFTSVFEVSFALHIVYSLIPQVQNAFLARTSHTYTSRFDAVVRLREIHQAIIAFSKEKVESKDFGTLFVLSEDLTQSYDRLTSDLESQLIGLLKFMIPISLFVAFFSILLLIYAGFFPQETFSGWLLFLIILFSLLPMPSMLIFTLIKTSKNRGHIKNCVEKLDQAIDLFHKGKITKINHKEFLTEGLN